MRSIAGGFVCRARRDAPPDAFGATLPASAERDFAQPNSPLPRSCLNG